VLKHLSETMNLDNGKEWFGRVKEVHYDKLKTSPVDIDHSINEGLLSKKEISKRLLYLKNYSAPFIIKCMPFQLTNTIEEINLSFEERQHIATKVLNNFSLIYLENRDKISQFCFDVISKNQDYVRRNFTSYNSSIRETPPNNSITATKDHFDSFMDRQNFVKDFRKRNWKDEPIIYYEDYIEDNDIKIINNPEYKNIFTNYKEIEKWMR
jgi:hypothetical protein